ncbi:cupin domain-containing protein [Microbacterium sp. SORGH_AS_0888]|uniref:cupin domain-containing protein n=1 Tax=Microbacterium sp. SORGH_AS_0888 TaxID=3041791 RepID=UPI00277F5DA5|nr:cupin domain-containing protein [Microbacterium sp. SORGH_AS_0888]MDQ1130037.1 putative cupin superfamily sugar epimerase [Microbacterium sp. SORGH_AS_0888]
MEPTSLARDLGLEPHPEGGRFRRMWTAAATVETPNGPRPAATCIHYLLAPGERSAWHVVTSDEIWLWHGPGTLALSLGGDADRPGTAETVVLGPDIAAGQRAQVTVPAGTWQAAEPVGDGEVLVSCVVSPGFSFDDWRLAEEDEGRVG